MPYCDIAIQIEDKDQVEQVLSRFAQYNFVGGRAAYLLDDGSYSVDAGENDVRAIYDSANGVVSFFCRYQSETSKYEKKVLSFATKEDLCTVRINLN